MNTTQFFITKQHWKCSRNTLDLLYKCRISNFVGLFECKENIGRRMKYTGGEMNHDKDSKILTQGITNSHSCSDSKQNVLPQKMILDENGDGTVDINFQYFSFSSSFLRSDDWKTKFIKTMLVYPNFIQIEEENILLKEIEPFISRLHYEDAHWDDAIHSYRETERSIWNKSNNLILDRIRAIGFPPPVRQLKLVHVLDLAKPGVIKPHIDSIRFCGNTIAGLSLLSDCIMRLRHEIQKDFYCDVHLPQRSLYVMSDFVRYEFTHEILPENDSKFNDKIIPRDRRISIICRNEPEQTPGPVFEPNWEPSSSSSSGIQNPS